MSFKDHSMKMPKYMLLLYMSFYMLEKCRILNEPSVLCSLLNALLKSVRSEAFVQHFISSSISLEHECNIRLPFFFKPIFGITPFPAVHIQVYIITGGFC